MISWIAGTPRVRTYPGDGGPATLATAGNVRGTRATLRKPFRHVRTVRVLHASAGVAGDGAGGFAFTDSVFLVVRYVSPSGIIRTIAGTGLGVIGSVGNGGPA